MKPELVYSLPQETEEGRPPGHHVREYFSLSADLRHQQILFLNLIGIDFREDYWT